MSHLTPAEKAVHILIAEDSFEDTCDIYTFSGLIDSYGDEQSFFTVTSGVSCGFSYGKASEDERGQTVILQADAVLRLSLAQPISVKDKVDVRNKFYTVDGVTDGITVKVVELKELDTNERD